jgi:hypothetical protein
LQRFRRQHVGACICRGNAATFGMKSSLIRPPSSLACSGLRPDLDPVPALSQPAANVATDPSTKQTSTDGPTDELRAPRQLTRVHPEPSVGRAVQACLGALPLARGCPAGMRRKRACVLNRSGVAAAVVHIFMVTAGEVHAVGWTGCVHARSRHILCFRAEPLDAFDKRSRAFRRHRPFLACLPIRTPQLKRGL